MSREIRRVPADWQHPTEPNPNWRFQRGWRRTTSRLHGEDEMFTPLYRDSVSVAQAEWDRERAEWEAGEHSSLKFSLEYHSPDGWVDHEGVRREPTPLKVYAEDGETVVREFYPTTVQEILGVSPFEEYAGERPTEDTHMPDFDVPEDALGWCLYETVSEGTPCTPVFATAEELIDHLCTVGEDYDQQPYRREAAEQVVRSGSSFASMVVIGGQLFDGSKDSDKIAERL